MAPWFISLGLRTTIKDYTMLHFNPQADNDWVPPPVDQSPLSISENGEILVGFPGGRTEPLPTPASSIEVEALHDQIFIESEGFEEETPYLVSGRFNLPQGELTSLFADSGLGKTFLMYDLAVCVATGKHFLESSTMQGNVLWLDFEMSRGEARRRIFKVARGHGIDPPTLHEKLIYKNCRSSGKTLHEVAENVRKLIRIFEPILLVLDSWSRAFFEDSVTNEDTNTANSLLSSFTSEERSVLTIDHESSGSRKTREVGGNRNKRHATRTQYRISAIGKNKNPFELEVTKSNYLSGPNITIERQGSNTDDFVRHVVVGTSTSAGDAASTPVFSLPKEVGLESRVLKTLHDAPNHRFGKLGQFHEALANGLGCSKRTAISRIKEQDVLTKLEEEGKIETKKMPGPGKPKGIFLVPSSTSNN